jgi:uncharacterized lipoprotein YmbA
MISVRSILVCVAGILAAGHVISCAGMQSTNKSLHALDVGKPVVAPNAPGAEPTAQVAMALVSIPREQVLQVRRVNIAPPFDGPSLVYRTHEGAYVKDYYNEWVAPPEELLSTQMVDWLSASGPFAAAVDGRSGASHRFALETCISSLYGDFHDPHKPKAVLDARVYLLDDASGGRNVAWQNHYDIVVPLDAASSQQFMLGAGSAYRQLLDSIARDLSAYRKTVVAANPR